MAITADQIEDLYNGGTRLELSSGATLTRDELVDYIKACDIDTDDDGTPLDSQWQILADVLDAPDPSNVTELATVAAASSALREVTAAPYEAVLEDHHDCISVAVHDLTAGEDPDMGSIATWGQLGDYPRGLANPAVIHDAIDWLRRNGWEAVPNEARIRAGYPQVEWQPTEALPVRPAAPADDLSRIAIAVSRIGEAEVTRDQAIRDALAAGHSVIAIANAASLSRARIYQIRDGRR
ncbi:hypothetical protein GCM10010331_48840 [Streptomyces xanthochromogenes]|uniref:hypothetical protein n=1 Tax=Streptomyces xanthochromogenes TaxID=67384 RepID=UPI0016796EBC|nr:hypothetical protein [Streptomyces xanthochromogenes]GHB55255.1 hypothetical protein GCM10010331_48840 [Streptomyces xanthochromogenes]